jgi:hypothetical protein
MPLDFCEDRVIGQQSTAGVSQMLLVAFGVALRRLVCSLTIGALFGLLLARPGPASFLTEMSSVGQPQGLALLSHFLLNSEPPISQEINPSRHCSNGRSRANKSNVFKVLFLKGIGDDPISPGTV